MGRWLISPTWSGNYFVGELDRETVQFWVLKPDQLRRPRTSDDVVVDSREEAEMRVAQAKAVYARYQPQLDELLEKRRKLNAVRDDFIRAALTQMEPAFAFQTRVIEYPGPNEYAEAQAEADAKHGPYPREVR